MKTKQKLLTWILVVALTFLLTTFACCDDKPQGQKIDVKLQSIKSNQMLVVVNNGDGDFDQYVVTLGEEGVNATIGEEVLSYLVTNSNLTLDWTDSTYGKTINKIGKLAPDANLQQYVAIYTSYKQDASTYAGATQYKLGGTYVYTAGLGISSLTVKAGVVLYFEMQTW